MEVTLELGLDDPDDDASLRAQLGKVLNRPVESLLDAQLLKRSLDCRHGRVRFHLLFAIDAATEKAGPGQGAAPELAEPHPKACEGTSQVVIVGDGPAGLFCAYQLARLGIKSTVLDRGKPVQPRRRDLKGLNQRGEVNADSNYCFGEGGAGTYSDGKLYTRSHKRGDVRDVIEILALHGAPENILVDARPHIGSNRLPKVITAMRECLEAVGVEFLFESRVVGLRKSPDGSRVAGVTLLNGEQIEGRAVVLATGHSARDVFEFLQQAGVRLEAKPFALGVRIEHPQPVINRIQYGSSAGHPKLPSAAYHLVDSRAQKAAQGSSVFSFCMCPGGFIVPASTSPGEMVVNGMSLSKRDSPYANSGLVLSITPEQVASAGFQSVLGGVELQRLVESAAFEAGGSNLQAPATRVTDFLAKRGSSTVPKSSYIPGLHASDIGDVLDRARISLSEQLRVSLGHFGKRLRGYITEEAVLVGVESRTSSPVRVPRNDALESLDLRGLYPAGEGAGYAGGIVSAAVDGMRVARSIAATLMNR